MFKENPKSAATKQQILCAALHLFRTRGFDQTTMREVSKSAGVALGGAYYYFPSKEAIVMAYYEQVHAEHERRVEEALAKLGKRPGLKQRLSIAMQSKIDIIAGDQKLLGALFRYTGVPSHPLSFLGPATKPLRDRAIGLFSKLTEGEDLPADIQRLLPLALWALHMGLMLYFLYDESPGQKRTRRLIDGTLELTEKLLKVMKLPLLRGVRRQVVDLLAEAQLLPQGDAR